MRRPSVLTTLLPLLSACAIAPAVLPSGGMVRVSANTAGAALTVFRAPWESSPWDLGDYVTPIAVEFFNGGAVPVRVSLVDLVLTDEQGRRYAALNPFPPDAPIGERDDPASLGTLVAVRQRGGVIRTGPPPALGQAPPRIGAPFALAPRVVRRPVVIPRGIGGQMILGGALQGYAPYPSYRAWLGGGIDYWGSPLLAPLGYASFVWYWSPAFYPSLRAPPDVLALGLPEGVLLPGGRVSGYLYFQRVNQRSHHFTLAWEVYDAEAGAPLGVASVPLQTER